MAERKTMEQGAALSLIALLGSLLVENGQDGSRLGQAYMEGRLIGCSFSFEAQRLGGLISVVLESGSDIPIVELTFFPDLDKPDAVPSRALLLDGDGDNGGDQRPPQLDARRSGSFAFKMGDRTTGSVSNMIQRRTLRFSYTLAGGRWSEASVSLSRYEAEQIGGCLARLTPGLSYLR
ncbi:MAG: hypothetical protein KKC29_01175 [Alphaproteobacteria bacterium]|nr:hypothetical protein [Alphaproteobacteria bacterium]MBU2289697.1 hypothetical protein [Alphaproteobacteria bacterium]